MNNIKIQTTESVYCCLCVYIYIIWEMTTHYWMTNQEAHLWGRLIWFFLSQKLLIAGYSSFRSGASWNFPIYMGLKTRVAIVQILFMQPYYFAGVASLYRKYNLTAYFLFLWFMLSFTPLLRYSLNFEWKSWIIYLSGHPAVFVLFILTSFGFLWWASAAGKSFFDERWDLHLSVDIKVSI